MGRTKINPPTDKKYSSTPIETFKHCIGWNDNNPPRITKKGWVVLSYRNRFILNKGDLYLDEAVKEGYMTKSDYCDNYWKYTLTDKGFKYLEEKENIVIIRDIDLAKIHTNYDLKSSSTKDVGTKPTNAKTVNKRNKNNGKTQNKPKKDSIKVESKKRGRPKKYDD